MSNQQVKSAVSTWIAGLFVTAFFLNPSSVWDSITVNSAEMKLIPSVTAVTIDANNYESKEVTFSYENIPSETAVSIRYVHGSDIVTDLSWGDWNNHVTTLYITNVRIGEEVINVELYNQDTEDILATTQVTVTVIGTPEVYPSETSVSLDMDNHSSKTVWFSYDNIPATTKEWNIRYIHGEQVATSLEWGDWSNHMKPLHITPSRVGEETISFELYDTSTGETLAETEIVVDVSGTPKVLVSKSSVSMNIEDNQAETIWLSYENIPASAKEWNIRFVHGDEVVTSLEWGEWENQKKPLYITPARIGKEVITFELVDADTKEVFATTSVTVSVDGTTKLISSQDAVSVDMDKNETAEVFFSYANLPATIQNFNIHYSHDDEQATTLKWGSWENGKIPLYISGHHSGTETITVFLADADTSEVLAQTQITATVTGTEKPAEIPETTGTKMDLSVGMQYEIKSNQTNLTYQSSNTDVVVVSKRGMITAVGEGKAVVFITNSDGDVLEIEVTVHAPVVGDCNNDGVLNVADIVLFQKWLHNVPNTHLADWKSTDMNGDNKLNVIDLALMKQKLIAKG
ncbi:MAG TPA: hypothetical protein DCO72_07970 [Ruminococcus sp.]|nr:hypothetical protein [Ruminococcus sp.]